MKIDYRLLEVKPKIFCLEFNHHYDMCMMFLRYQEFYESSSIKFRGKSFEIFDFMRWYSYKFGGGSFTYTNDWSGFNLNSNVIKQVHDLGITDKNIYDYEMLMAWKECRIASKGEKFCIIGTYGDSESLDHEIAHAFFYLHPSYQKEMIRLVKALDPAIRKSINSSLKKMGYTPKVYIDETQAYMATGLATDFEWKDKWTKEQKPFEARYREFSRRIV